MTGAPAAELPPLRDVIARHGLRANKALGQNFLLDGQLLARIAAIPGPLAGETVYEVGPGPGGLTRALPGCPAGAAAAAQPMQVRFFPVRFASYSAWSARSSESSIRSSSR